MFFVAGENLLPILVALLIGFVTGLWIWKLARRPAATRERVLTDDEPMRRPYIENQTPTPDVAPRFEARKGPRPEPEVLARRAASSPLVTNDAVGLASGAAAAVEDVADQFLGLDSHPGAGDAAGGDTSDDLQTMKGLGPKLAGLLRAEGITRFDQIAALTPADLARLDLHLGAFKGRLARDRIVEQAAFLARGDREGYEREFGRL